MSTQPRNLKPLEESKSRNGLLCSWTWGRFLNNFSRESSLVTCGWNDVLVLHPPSFAKGFCLFVDFIRFFYLGCQATRKKAILQLSKWGAF